MDIPYTESERSKPVSGMKKNEVKTAVAMALSMANVLEKNDEKRNFDMLLDAKKDSLEVPEHVMDSSRRTKKKSKPSVFAEIRETMRIFCSRKASYVLPQMIWAGASVAYWSGMLVPMMSWHQKLNDPDESP